MSSMNYNKLREAFEQPVDVDEERGLVTVDADALWLIYEAARFLLSLVDEGGRLVVEQPCEHGALEPHGWVCGAHDDDEKCPRQNCGAYLDFGEHCAQLHRKDDACWSASACGGGSRRVVWPTDKEEW